MGVLRSIDARVKLVCLVAYIIVTLHARTLVSLAVCLAAAVALAAAARLGPRDVRGVMRPLVPILVVTVVMQVLYIQQGEVFAWLGPVALTREALGESGRMLVSLLSVMLASVAFMRCTDTEELMRTLRWLLTPLHVAGARTEGFMLSLSVAFRFIPVLAADFQQLKRAQESRCGSFAGGVRERLESYMRLFPPLVRSSFRRADTLAQAFVARCFSCGITPTAMHVGRVGAREVVCLVATVALAAVTIAL